MDEPTCSRRDAASVVFNLPEVDTLRVRHMGVDEHRFARARFFRDDTGGWQRVEPWRSTFVNTDTGQVLGIVDGRNSTGIQGWLDARTPAWRDRIEDRWDEIETFIETRVTNARTEAANTDIKHIKRTGRGYRNHHHYQRRILLRSHRQTRRRCTRLNQQATAANCE